VMCDACLVVGKQCLEGFVCGLSDDDEEGFHVAKLRKNECRARKMKRSFKFFALPGASNLCIVTDKRA
jgi:hypothetical protein